MARNAEKAMTALARWRRMKEQEEKGPVAKRPNDVKECTIVMDAERYRKEITLDIAKKISLIQNPGLGEFKIRDTNDEINKMLKVKYAWEYRIKELGGPDYRRVAPKMLDKQGREVAGSRGYKYFGAAKDLPGVRELFERGVVSEAPRKNRAEMMKDIDADYYGYMDDDDGLLLPLEQAEERVARAKLEEEWESTKDQRRTTRDDDDDIYRVQDDSDEDEELGTVRSVVLGDDGQVVHIQHVAVPSQSEIEQLLLERKKIELTEKYLGSSLADQAKSADALIGFEKFVDGERKLVDLPE